MKPRKIAINGGATDTIDGASTQAVKPEASEQREAIAA
jgi:hypothetical protein